MRSVALFHPKDRPGGGPANSRNSPWIHADSTQRAADPGGEKFRPAAPNPWRVHRISAERMEIVSISPLERSTRRKADQLAATTFSGFRVYILDNRPMVRAVRNAALSRQVSGDFAEFGSIGRAFRRIGRIADQREAEIFHDFMEILQNRPQILGVRNSALPPQLGGDFVEFRPTGRNSAGSRPPP